MRTKKLDETWALCLKMWEWIVGHPDLKVNNCHYDSNVESLKDQWLNKNYPKHIKNGCFFCNYAFEVNDCLEPSTGLCKDCPGEYIEEGFDCMADPNYEDNPKEFYNYLTELYTLYREEPYAKDRN